MASRGSYQRDDGCARTSQRHDVEVVGEVELRTEKGSVSGLGEEMKNRATEQRRRRSGQRPLTSLVLQISPRVAPHAFPGVAFMGIIPTGSEG